MESSGTRLLSDYDDINSLGQNIDTIKKGTQLDSSTKIGLEVNT
jgi:hypothetical protein